MHIFGLSILAVALLPSGGYEGSSEAIELVERYVDLHKSGDIEGLLALHTEDAEYLIPGQEPIRGITGLRNLFAWDAALGSELRMDGVRTEGDAIVIDAVVERNKWFGALGVSDVHYRPGTRLVLRGGRIKAAHMARFDEATEQLVMAEFGRLLAWLSVHRPKVQSQLLPNGKFRYDGSTAKLWLTVMQEWKAQP